MTALDHRCEMGPVAQHHGIGADSLVTGYRIATAKLNHKTTDGL